MKMSQGFKPELLTSDDESRPDLCCLHYDGDSLIASNGKAAVRVPVMPDEKDDTKAVSIPAHVWKWVRQLCKDDGHVSLVPMRGEWQAGREESDLFTDHRAIIPREVKPKAKTVSLSTLFSLPERKEIELVLSAKLLGDMAKAMGTDNVRLFIDPTDMAATIRVRPVDGMGIDEAVGVLAPLKTVERDGRRLKA